MTLVPMLMMMLMVYGSGILAATRRRWRCKRSEGFVAAVALCVYYYAHLLCVLCNWDFWKASSHFTLCVCVCVSPNLPVATSLPMASIKRLSQLQATTNTLLQRLCGFAAAASGGQPPNATTAASATANHSG